MDLFDTSASAVPSGAPPDGPRDTIETEKNCSGPIVPATSVRILTNAGSTTGTRNKNHWGTHKLVLYFTLSDDDIAKKKSKLTSSRLFLQYILFLYSVSVWNRIL